jgi:DNA invertase Pin-like site-specific DNA recombinase
MPTTQSTPKRAVAYVRISRDRDNETSTTTQRERLAAYAKAHGWRVVKTITEPGRSAYNSSRSSRPGFREAMQLVEAGAAEVLLVWKLDRACRNTIDTLELVEELKGHGAALVSVTEHFDAATPTGELTLTMLAALARMESATKSERQQAWQSKRATEGAVPTGPRTFGYRRSGPNKMIVDKAEAAMLRRAVKQLLAGASVRSLVLVKDGKQLGRAATRTLLRSPIPAGGRLVDGVFMRGDWTPIIERKDWEKVCALLADPDRRTTPGPTRRWMLAGIARCAECDVALTSRSHQRGSRYVCPECQLSIQCEPTDELIAAALCELLDAKTWRRLKRNGAPTRVAADAFEEAMGELSARFVAQEIDSAQLADLAEALRAQVEVSTRAMPKLPNVEDVRKAWPRLSIDQRRLVLSAATESLTIKPYQHRWGFDESRVAWVPVA